MKKIVLALIAASTLSSMAIARDSSNGCGLGWEVTDKKTMSATTTRTTTNMTIPNTFGMTSGTIGCEQHSIVKNDKAPVHFSEANYEVLMSEMAAGQGETLNNFAAVLGCDQTQFANSLQSNYSVVAQAQSGVELLNAVRANASCQSL